MTIIKLKTNWLKDEVKGRMYRKNQKAMKMLDKRIKKRGMRV